MSTVPIRSSPRSWLASLACILPASGWPPSARVCRPAEDLFNKLLASKAIARAVEDEARSKKISHEGTAERYRADGRDCGELLIRDDPPDRPHSRLHTGTACTGGINVHNAERVRQLAHDGHEIVYVPCHRSHMDYLLLSYVLYHQGLVPPHIAAGINLNFWPAGPIFRRLGAFFIRRTFKGNKLYSTVFREYLGELFSRGYSVEYFVEGGRSRTGRLLDPKTGTLSMTIQGDAARRNPTDHPGADLHRL